MLGRRGSGGEGFQNWCMSTDSRYVFTFLGNVNLLMSENTSSLESADLGMGTVEFLHELQSHSSTDYGIVDFRMKDRVHR